MQRPHPGITSSSGPANQGRHGEIEGSLVDVPKRDGAGGLALRGDPVLVSLEKGYLWGHLTAPPVLQEVIKEMESGSLQWCMAGEQQWAQVETRDEKLFPESTVRQRSRFPRELSAVHLWKFSRPQNAKP